MMKREWNDFLNPVFVKEIRQYFHNKLIVGVMALLLLLQLLLLVFFQSRTVGDDLLEGAGGTTMFGIVLLGVAGAIFLVCGVGSLNRFTAERRNRELDYSCLTNLSPNRIIGGKLAAALVMAVFLLSLSLPFLVIAYFLRGISILVMLICVLVMLPLVLISAQGGILVGSAGREWLKLVYILGVLFFAWPVLMLLGFMVWGQNLIGGDYPILLAMTGFVMLGSLLLLGLLYALSVAAISHVAANRMLPVRVYLLALLPAAPVLSLAVLPFRDRFGGAPPGRGELAAILLYGVLGIGMNVVIVVTALASFEREHAGGRVLRHCPRSAAGRFGFFLLSSGVYGGLTLGLLIQAALALIALPAVRLPEFDAAAGMFLLGSGFYYIFYAEAALLLRRRIPALPGWAWWLIVSGFFTMFPAMFSSAAGDLAIAPRLLLVTSPACLMPGLDGEAYGVAWVAPLLSLLLFLWCLPLIRREFRSFRREGALPAGDLLEKIPANGRQ